MSDRTYRDEMRDFIDEAADDDRRMPIREFIKLQAMRLRRPHVIEQEIFNQAQRRGLVPAGAKIDDVMPEEGIDRDKLREYLLEALIAMLQILQLWL